MPPGDILFSYGNRDYLPHHLHWLCNTAGWPGVHERTILAVQDEQSRESIRKLSTKVHTYVVPELARTHGFYSKGYRKLTIKRIAVLVDILSTGRGMIMFEGDALWTRNILHDVDLAGPTRAHDAAFYRDGVNGEHIGAGACLCVDALYVLACLCAMLFTLLLNAKTAHTIDAIRIRYRTCVFTFRSANSGTTNLKTIKRLLKGRVYIHEHIGSSSAMQLTMLVSPGLMSMKGNRSGALTMWTRVLDRIQKDMKPFHSLPDSATIPPERAKHEQVILLKDVLPAMLNHSEIKVIDLDRCTYASGLWYTRKAPHIKTCGHIPPAVLNNNWIEGNQNKINRAKERKHWFLHGDRCAPWNATLTTAINTFK